MSGNLDFDTKPALDIPKETIESVNMEPGSCHAINHHQNRSQSYISAFSMELHAWGIFWKALARAV